MRRPTEQLPIFYLLFEIRLDFSVFDADDPPCLRRDIVIMGDQNHGSSLAVELF